MNSVDTFFKNLKVHRENQGINLSEISERTKINEKYFESIENGEMNILPTVYMRLFLRSYCIEIGADPDQALKDFELYTTGKISQTPELKFKPVEDEKKEDDLKNEFIDFGNSITRKNIIYFIIGIIVIFALVKFVGYLTQEAESTLPESANPVSDVQNGPDISDELPSFDNNPLPYSNLPASAQLLESYVYNPQKLVQRYAFKISARPPFRMTVIAEARTKIHITTMGNNLFNGILNVGDTRTFSSTDTLRFDFWSAQHVKTDVNGIDLTPYFSRSDRAIRGSLVADGSLSIQAFMH